MAPSAFSNPFSVVIELFVDVLPLLLCFPLLMAGPLPSSSFIHPTNPSSTSSPLPVFQSATSNKEHFSRLVPGKRGPCKEEEASLGLESCSCTASRAVGVGGREQTSRPHKRQWCFLFDNPNAALVISHIRETSATQLTSISGIFWLLHRLPT